jgi:hypothetical protein
MWATLAIFKKLPNKSITQWAKIRPISGAQFHFFLHQKFVRSS